MRVKLDSWLSCRVLTTWVTFFKTLHIVEPKRRINKNYTRINNPETLSVSALVVLTLPLFGYPFKETMSLINILHSYHDLKVSHACVSNAILAFYSHHSVFIITLEKGSVATSWSWLWNTLKLAPLYYHLYKWKIHRSFLVPSNDVLILSCYLCRVLAPSELSPHPLWDGLPQFFIIWKDNTSSWLS